MGEDRSKLGVRRARRVPWIRLLAAALVAVSASTVAGAAGPAVPAGAGEATVAGLVADEQTPPDYGDPGLWVCRPDRPDVCDGDLDTTIVPADGELRVEPWRPARRPTADCFYVYPTVSLDLGLHSDLAWSPDQEGAAARAQAARFGAACRVFAPAYRQLTLPAALTGRGLEDPEAIEDFSYADVVAAWRHYLAHDNQGRDVVLIGHSQGASMAARLLRDEVEPDRALRRRLVAAYIAGTAIQVEPGTDRLDGYATPLCTRFLQTGCAVVYSSYRSTVPPGPLALTGRDAGDGLEAACTNPARLLRPFAHPDATTWLTPAFGDRALAFETLPPGPWVDPAHGTVTTPFATPTRFLDGRCVARNGFHYLEVTVHGDPADPRVDDIGGDFVLPGFTPDMLGLHNVDVNLVLGDLVRLAALQSFVHDLR